jgi:hypothetical protein
MPRQSVVWGFVYYSDKLKRAVRPFHLRHIMILIGTLA